MVNPELVVGLGLGTAAAATAFLAYRFLKKQNPVEVLEVTHNRADNRVEVKVINTSGRLYCITESALRRIHEAAAADGMMAAQAGQRRMLDLLAESDEMVLIRPGEVKTLSYDIMLTDEFTGVDLSNVEFTLRGEEIELAQFTLEGTANVRVEMNPVEPEPLRSEPQETMIEQPVAEIIQATELLQKPTEPVIQQPPEAEPVEPEPHYVKVGVRLNGFRLGEPAEKLRKMSEALPHVMRNMNTHPVNRGGVAFPHLLQKVEQQPAEVKTEDRPGAGLNLGGRESDLDLRWVRESMLYSLFRKTNLFTRVDEQGKPSGAGVSLRKYGLHKKVPELEAVELQEISFSTGVQVEVNGRPFTIERLMGDFGGEKNVGGRALTEVNYTRVYGSFAEGRFCHREQWIEGSGTLLVDAGIIKSVIVKPPSLDTK